MKAILRLRLRRFCFVFDCGTASEEESNGDQISKVTDHLSEGWVAVVAEERLEQFAKNGFFVNEGVDIPNMFNNGRDPGDFIEFMDAMRYETCGKEDEQNSCDLKEAAQVKAHSRGK